MSQAGSLPAAGDHLAQLQSICSAMQGFPQPNPAPSLAGNCSFFSSSFSELTKPSLPVRSVPLSHSLTRVVTHGVTRGRTEGGRMDTQHQPCCLFDSLLRLGHLSEGFWTLFPSRDVCRDVQSWGVWLVECCKCRWEWGADCTKWA